MALEFGFYPRPYQVAIGSITIETLPELETKVAALSSSEYVHRGWFYAPGRSRVFSLPKTHRISYHQVTNDSHLEFLIWCFSFFVGMRQSCVENGFLVATSINERAMIDIIWLGDSLEKAIDSADHFWHKYSDRPRVPKILTGVIHAYFLAQRRELLECEKFIYLYMALDGCFCVHDLLHPKMQVGCNQGSRGQRRRTTHQERVKILCYAYHIVADLQGGTVPEWAAPDASTNIVGIRNATLHEGLFFDEPLGFQGFSENTFSENTIYLMSALVRRLVVALLELSAPEYIRLPLPERAPEGVQL